MITQPWFFAYDRVNYSRFHTLDLLTLKADHPEIQAEFMNGNFSVQLSQIQTSSEELRQTKR